MQSAPVGNGKSFLWQQCSSSSRQQNIVELYSCLAKSHKSSVHFANSWTVPKLCGCQSGSFGKCGERVYTKLLIRTVGTGDIVLAVSQAKRLNKDDLTYQVLRITIIVCHALQSDCMSHREGKWWGHWDITMGTSPNYSIEACILDTQQTMRVRSRLPTREDLRQYIRITDYELATVGWFFLQSPYLLVNVVWCRVKKKLEHDLLGNSFV